MKFPIPSFYYRAAMLAMTCYGSTALAQPSILDTMSIEQLMQTKISAASAGEALSQRESPGVVTLITQEEIRNSGARDLMDLLRMVPGMEFSQDVIGAVALTVRGNWAQEGKVLLLIDGEEMNELAYNSLPLGNRYTADMIERIEVIRGPGSARYGGFAELGVINVITKQAKDIQGAKISGLYGTTANGMVRNNLSLSAGAANKKGTSSIVFHASAGQGQRSDRVYTNLAGQSYPLLRNADINQGLFSVKASHKGLTLLVMQDNYGTSFNHYNGIILKEAYPSLHRATHVDVRYTIEALKKRLVITPRLNYRSFNPYAMNKAAAPGEDSTYVQILQGNTPVTRLLGGLNAAWNVSRALNLVAGAEFTQDKAAFDVQTVEGRATRRTFWTGKPEVTFQNLATYFQALFKGTWGTITVGGRVDDHNIYGTIAAPRFAYTKAFSRFHIKALASGAYRVPAPQNIAGSALLNGVPSIKPERTTVVEAEMGYRLAKNLSVQGNVFFSLITGVIAFDAAQFGFINSGRTGSNGVEVELRYKRNRGYITANYSYYTSLQNNIASYATLRKNELLGAAHHKVGLNAYYSFMRDLGVNVNGTFLSGKYAYTGLNTDGSPKMTFLNPTLLLNMYGQYNGLLKRKLGLGLGCYNILGTNYAFAQAYNGGDAPIISTGREVSLKVTYTF